MPDKKQPQKLTIADAKAIIKLANAHLKLHNKSGVKLESLGFFINEEKANVSGRLTCAPGQIAVKVYQGGTWRWECQ